MHSVADILKPEFSRSWHEAVALVQEVASQLPKGVAVPAPEDLLIDPSGALSLGFAAEAGEAPVAGLARLLQAALKGTVPPAALTALANENATAKPAHPNVESFMRALAFFERPGRVNDLGAVAGRLNGVAPPPKPPDEVVVELREKIAAVHEAHETPKKKRNRRLIPFAAGGIGAAALVAALVTFSGFGPAGNGTAVMDRVEQKIANVVSDGLNRLGGASRPAEAADITLSSSKSAGRKPVSSKAEASPREPAPATGGRPAARTSKDAAVPLAAKAAPLSNNLPIVLTKSDGPSAPEPAREPAEEKAVSTPSSGVYTTADGDVTPPVFIRPQLPHLPEPDEKTGYFEVLINEDGDVDTVKLYSPMRRYYDRMLVAAAKAWKFQPAMRDGRPVRFKARIAIIVADPH